MQVSDDEGPDMRRPSNPGAPRFDSTLEDELEKEEPVERVIVFTTRKLLGLLALCKRGLYFYYFKSVTMTRFKDFPNEILI